MFRAFFVAVLMGLVVAVSASADVIAIPSAPNRYDHVRVERVEPDSAPTRLVLLPASAGAGVAAPRLVRRTPGVQVWIVAGRYENLEDRRMLDGGTAEDALRYPTCTPTAPRSRRTAEPMPAHLSQSR